MSLNAVQANISLHHLEIKSDDPKKLAEFYSNVFIVSSLLLIDEGFYVNNCDV